MPYDLEEIESFCSAEGFSYTRVSRDEIRVQVGNELELCFANIERRSDTYLGFSDSQWHTHDELILMTGENTYIQLTPIEVLAGLKSGELLIASSYSNGILKDRWIFHSKEKQDFQYLGNGESIIIQKAEPGDAPYTHPRHASCGAGAAPRAAVSHPDVKPA